MAEVAKKIEGEPGILPRARQREARRNARYRAKISGMARRGARIGFYSDTICEKIEAVQLKELKVQHA
jgi:hypothetical protein